MLPRNHKIVKLLSGQKVDIFRFRGYIVGVCMDVEASAMEGAK
jgi:hypothetical protein